MKKIERSWDNRMLFGVCGGFARAFGWDSDLVRVMWILTSLLGGAGIFVYVAAIFLLPEAERPQGEESPVSGSRILGLVLMGLAGGLFLHAFDVNLLGARLFKFWTIGILLPLTLLVAGVFLVWPRARSAVGFGERKPRRSVTDRVLAGVAGGIARELDVDSNLIRLAFVLAGALTSGFALLIYLMLVLVLPEEEVEIPGVPVAAGPMPTTASQPAPGGETAETTPGPPASDSEPSDDPSEGEPEDQGTKGEDR